MHKFNTHFHKIKQIPFILLISFYNSNSISADSYLDKLIIPDFETIAELTTFSSKHNSYEAEEGSNDDLAMTLVIFSWLVQQQYFKDMTDLDIRQQMYKDQMESLEQDMLPFGIIDSGQEEETFTDGTGQGLEVADPDHQRSYF